MPSHYKPKKTAARTAPTTAHRTLATKPKPTLAQTNRLRKAKGLAPIITPNRAKEIGEEVRQERAAKKAADLKTHRRDNPPFGGTALERKTRVKADRAAKLKTALAKGLASRKARTAATVRIAKARAKLETKLNRRGR